MSFILQPNTQRHLSHLIFATLLLLLAAVLYSGILAANANTDPKIELGISEYSKIDQSLQKTNRAKTKKCQHFNH